MKKNKLLGERLKRLREDNSHRIDLLYKWCRARHAPKDCENSDGDLSKCISCIHGLRDNDSQRITRDILAKQLCYSEKTLGLLEQTGYGKAITLYKEFFGEELFDKYVGASVNTSEASDLIGKRFLAQPNWFFCREAELKTLQKMFSENPITIICADGGVGKTTLATQFLSRAIQDDYEYCGTVLFSGKEAFDEQHFLTNIDLSTEGQRVLDSMCEGKSDDEREEIRRQLVIKSLNDYSVTRTFLLDDFTVIDSTVLSLREKYPNCKFIITTRNKKGIGNNYDNCILHLNYFTKEQALEVFNGYRKDLAKEADAEEFQPVYDWCEGNAEVLYFIAKMLGSRPISIFSDEFIERREFEAENKKTKVEEKSNMAQKLKRLFGFDHLLPDFAKQYEPTDPEHKIIRALAVFSISEMQPIPRENLLQFLTGDRSDEDSSDNCLTLLQDRGFVKSDGNGGLFMHPLISNALKLNGIEKHRSEDMYIFIWLINAVPNNIKSFLKLVANRIEIIFPRGINKLPIMYFLQDLKSICISEDFDEIPSNGFVIPRELLKIEVSEKNRSFTAINGVLYSKNMKTLILYPGGRSGEEFCIPEGVENIADYAFSNCKNHKRIVVPNTVKTIGEHAFDELACLEIVVLPNNITLLSTNKVEEMKALYNRSLTLLKEHGSISTPYIQKMLNIGYAAAHAIMERMIAMGIIKKVGRNGLPIVDVNNYIEEE